MNYTSTYEIIKCESLKNIIYSSEVSPEEVYRYMYQLNADILYIVENGCLSGVISIGDLLRYYEEHIPLKINTDFRFVRTFNSPEAYKILKEIPSIHELPVVGEDGAFLGIVKFGEKGQEEWERLKKHIDNKRFGSEEDYLYEEFRNWLLRQRARIVIYDRFSWEKWEQMAPNSKSFLEKRKENVSEEEILPLHVLKNMTEPEQKLFFGRNYSNDCVKEFLDDYEKIELTLENGIYSINDLSSKYFTFKNGYRITPNNTGEAQKIYVYGRCQILGSYVSDNGTIEYFLKEELMNHGYLYDVVNGGLWMGNTGYLWVNRMLRTDFTENDIVIIGSPFFNVERLKEDRDLDGKYDLFDYFGNTYEGVDNSSILSHILDDPCHHDSFINSLAAQNIMRDIAPLLKQKAYPYFIPWNTIQYYKKYFAVNGMEPSDKKTGAIIMTCNPFTLGHRYLIEKACEEVEVLYVFIVEEEIAGFSFHDRFEMVGLGVRDLAQVKVLPLGKHILSKETFPQYFDKDNVTEVKKMDYDIYVFAETIAKELGITCRFVGEEPFDKVTRAYNETMKRILPQFGIAVKIIPRKSDKKNNVISATFVRRCLKDGNTKELYSLLPNTSIEYLKKTGKI